MSAIQIVSVSQVERDIEKLRSDANYCYLNGRNAVARKLNKKADVLSRGLSDPRKLPRVKVIA